MTSFTTISATNGINKPRIEALIVNLLPDLSSNHAKPKAPNPAVTFDLFLFPSHTETFGNVTLEAMASGLPCLVADAIGSKSLVNDGVNGKWAKKQDVKDFTEKLEWLISDENRLKEMGDKSREMAVEYEWDKINAGLVENYREAMDLPKPQLKF